MKHSKGKKRPTCVMWLTLSARVGWSWSLVSRSCHWCRVTSSYHFPNHCVTGRRHHPQEHWKDPLWPLGCLEKVKATSHYLSSAGWPRVGSAGYRLWKSSDPLTSKNHDRLKRTWWPDCSELPVDDQSWCCSCSQETKQDQVTASETWVTTKCDSCHCLKGNLRLEKNKGVKLGPQGWGCRSAGQWGGNHRLFSMHLPSW